jgi:hypothetical protein
MSSITGMLETDSACISGTSVPEISGELLFREYPVERVARAELFYSGIGVESITVT